MEYDLRGEMHETRIKNVTGEGRGESPEQLFCMCPNYFEALHDLEKIKVPKNLFVT